MPRSLPRILALLVLVGVAVIVFIFGYMPPDDALRHVGKAITGRNWHDILVMREGIYAAMDSHPGWHAILRGLHLGFGLDGSALVHFSVFALFLTAVLPPVLLNRRPLLWLVVLALACWVEPGSFFRLFLGRPLLLTMGVSLTILLLWEKERGIRPSRGALIAIPLIVGLAVWCHSTWYLFAMPLAAIWATNPGRRAAWYTLLTCSGILLGACITGHPLDYLFYQLEHLYWSLLEPGSGIGLAGELRPYQGTHYLLIIGLLLSLLRDFRRFGQQFKNPLLVLTIACWLLSFKATRFWVDWGFPCLLLWMASELGVWLDRIKPGKRVSFYGMLAAVVILFAGIVQRRAFFSLNTPLGLAIDITRDPSAMEWLPGPQGVVYATDMRFFYNLFFLFPDSSWRYAPGFEPGLMPHEDSELYRAWRENQDATALQQWASKLKPSDRLGIIAAENNPPPTCGLVWHFWAPYYWVGKTNDVVSIPFASPADQSN